MSRLSQLKVLLADVGINEDDELLSTYLDFAGQKILHKMYPFGMPDEVTDVPFRYQSRQVEIALQMFLKRGAEGELTHTENGITRQCARGDIPSELLSDIPSFVKGLG